MEDIQAEYTHIYSKKQNKIVPKTMYAIQESGVTDLEKFKKIIQEQLMKYAKI